MKEMEKKIEKGNSCCTQSRQQLTTLETRLESIARDMTKITEYEERYLNLDQKTSTISTNINNLKITFQEFLQNCKDEMKDTITSLMNNQSTSNRENDTTRAYIMA